MEQTELRAYLACSPFLRDCPLTPDQVRLYRFRAGQIVSDRQAGTACVGLILCGRVEVYSVALDGRDILLNTLEQGECFGIANLVGTGELDTVLRCASDTRVLYIQKAALLDDLAQDTGLALRYAALCNEKLQFLIRRIELLTMQSCRGKIIAYLLAHQNAAGVVTDTGSREELARTLGISRAALFRELAALQNLDVLRTEGSTLTVLDSAMLEELLYHPSGTK